MKNNYNPFEIINTILKETASLKRETDVRPAGRVISSYDGVVMIEGLMDVQNGELVRISGDSYAIALNLETDVTGAILLSASDSISPGDIVYPTGETIKVPSGDNFLGRVIDPLGQPLDGKGPIRASSYRDIESPAPTIFDRAKVDEPLFTGIKAIDVMVPIGKGQRELIIGDRQTGKTAITLDTIVNQKGKDVICVYVAIGQKTSSVARVVKDLTKQGAMDYTIVVTSTAGQPAPLQYLTPYAATAVAEEFMYRGKDVLIIYDDLSKHAVAYRTISLLLKRPSGREAYPGDIFYIHSRLLERSAKLAERLGGGSLTALPIVETLDGDISSYIPTNVISITDGQIYLEADLFNSGLRPAINVGLSVSRVGGAAQSKAVRKVSGKIRLNLAQYREMQVFARFDADLDDATKAILKHGAVLTEALKQPQFNPVPMADMVIKFLILQSNLLDDFDPKDAINILTNFIQIYKSKSGHKIYDRIATEKDLTDEDAQEILDEFKEYIAVIKS
ncbi:MAG TPA: F0F1 ATP synthase subunit alpha [Clostridia bacterium]|jgi:F-type H+-transporting ATPase subunit alpha|nr:F0F1 ATP synthase subunit alpha [Clostridia bacterium]